MAIDWGADRVQGFYSHFIVETRTGPPHSCSGFSMKETCIAGRADRVSASGGYGRADADVAVKEDTVFSFARILRDRGHTSAVDERTRSVDDCEEDTGSLRERSRVDAIQLVGIAALVALVAVSALAAFSPMLTNLASAAFFV